MSEKPRIGVSACLLGQRVRYDGQHKRDYFITDVLGPFVEYVPVCPEVECGFGVPREPFRLVGDPASPRFVETRSGTDYTERMTQWARKRVEELEKENLCGFIFKSKSPGSGMTRVKVYNEKGHPAPVGVGIFAREFMRHFPLLPVEDEARLHNPAIRENFIERLFTLKRWREAIAGRRSIAALVRFHACHKLLLMAHSQKHLRAMGRLVADAKKADPKSLYARYETALLEALSQIATVSNHYNVLLHILGHLRNFLSADERQELLELFAAYRKGHIPLIVPITLINHFVRKHRPPYLVDQVYLNPHPLELQLRNHV